MKKIILLTLSLLIAIFVVYIIYGKVIPNYYFENNKKHKLTSEEIKYYYYNLVTNKRICETCSKNFNKKENKELDNLKMRLIELLSDDILVKVYNDVIDSGCLVCKEKLKEPHIVKG